MEHRFSAAKQVLAEIVLKIALTLFTVAVAIAIPVIGAFVSLVGAIGIGVLGLVFPPIIETITYWDRPGLGKFYWRLWKNYGLLLFAVLTCFIGAYQSVLGIVQELSK